MTTAAATIAHQIGNRAFVMMGARDLVDCGSALQFAVGKNEKKVTKVRVELDPSDTYTVRFYTGSAKVRFNARGELVGGHREIETVEGVYVDALRPTLERHTGMHLSL